MSASGGWYSPRITYAKITRKIFPTSVTAWAAGALFNHLISSQNTDSIDRLRTYVYGRRLTIFQATAGLIVCGATDSRLTAVALTESPGVICAKYRCALPVA